MTLFRFSTLVDRDDGCSRIRRSGSAGEEKEADHAEKQTDTCTLIPITLFPFFSPFPPFPCNDITTLGSTRSDKIYLGGQRKRYADMRYHITQNPPGGLEVSRLSVVEDLVLPLTWCTCSFSPASYATLLRKPPGREPAC